MILTILSNDPGGKDEIGVVYKGERSPPVLAPEQPEEQQQRLPSLCCLDGRPPLQIDSLPFRRNRFKTSQTNPPWALTGKGERLVIVGEYAGCLVVPIIIHHQLSTHVLNAPRFTTFLRSYSL